MLNYSCYGFHYIARYSYDRHDESYSLHSHDFVSHVVTKFAVNTQAFNVFFCPFSHFLLYHQSKVVLEYALALECVILRFQIAPCKVQSLNDFIFLLLQLLLTLVSYFLTVQTPPQLSQGNSRA